jgi:hypothetical protein
MNVWSDVYMNATVYIELCCLMGPINRHTVAGTQTWVESRGEEYLGRKLDKFIEDLSHFYACVSLVFTLL